MKKTTVLFALAMGVASIAANAQAYITVHLIDKTAKPLEFSLMVPRTKIYSALSDGRVPAGATRGFSFHQLLPSCVDRNWRCSKLKPVIQHWGHYVVFTACPKISSAYGREERWYKITGNDTAHLRCRNTRKPRPKTQTPTA